MEDETKQKVVDAINKKECKVSEDFTEQLYKDTPFKTHIHSISFDRCWNYSMYEIFKDNISIGKLYRNYCGYKKVFQPCIIDGKWYFLFSESYTQMSIYNENLEKINNTKSEFCPIDVYVPRFKIDSVTSEYVSDNDEFYDVTKNDSEPFYTNFAFISGCHWGDDTTMKIRVIDLSDIENEFNDTEEYGYLEISYDLRKSIIFNKCEYPNLRNIKILSTKYIKNLNKYML